MVNQTTEGPWEDEKSTCDAFDIAIRDDRRFSNIYSEVTGIYTSRSPYEENKTPRIDRVLIPSRALRNAEWVHGPIGIEIKAPGSKLGRPIAQCLDYLRASFEIMPGFHVPLSMVFLFQAPRFCGDLESIAIQHRIGTASLHRRGHIRFWRGATEIISLEEPSRNYMTLRKVGSR